MRHCRQLRREGDFVGNPRDGSEARKHVRVLTPGSAALWFEAVDASLPSGEESSDVEARIGRGLFQPFASMVVERDGKPFGRMTSMVKERAGLVLRQSTRGSG
jgi:hypothetical protein